MPRKLHIGGIQPHPDWEILNIQSGPNVDHVGDAGDMSQFENETFDEIYSSHVVEHFDYKNDLLNTLKEWRRILKSDGKMYVSVPDMNTLCQLFIKRDELNIDERVQVMRMMFGGHMDDHDYHYVGLDADILIGFLLQAGFKEIKRVENLGVFNDTSNMKFRGVPISLNLIASKNGKKEES